MPNIFSRFLFSVPNSKSDISAICDSEEARKAAFDAILAYMSDDTMDTVMQEISSLSSLFTERNKNLWNLQMSHEIKRTSIEFSGLKNQGCTCYMNSLLQQLFLSVEFREAVLNTPIRHCHRSTLWHRTDDELVGCTFLFQWANGWKRGTIVGYVKGSNPARHQVKYDDEDGEDVSVFNIRSGRPGAETGIIRHILSPEEQMTEEDSAALLVLEQLQRTFTFMKYSKLRYFDPRPFVDACKSLNLNFNVYQQNDAAEFCDQLLDRLETSMKGKYNGLNSWDDCMLKTVFGGKTLYQKIPQECGVYNTEKKECGHWQSSRQENFLKIELIIRGKEKIEDSLADHVKGELMDGENCIMCDVCNEKKATTRRTCLDNLPNLLILHLKRFDLDFQTFETVKLNNKMEFPTKLNMFKYTREGMEAEEL